MLKKLIAGALSASLLVSAAVSGNLNSLVTEKNTPSDRTVQKSELSVEGSNSLGKMIGDAYSEKEAEGIQPLSTSFSEKVFEVSDLNFDLNTGKITVYSSQSLDCEILVSFIDEDNKSNKIDLKSKSSKGCNVLTELSVDVNELPEFFNVRAVLVDYSGHELCKASYFNHFTHFMQEMYQATINDFDEAYVVNLDDDETTNFFVLNEKTVIADSSDDSNTLVSADYDNNTYVFDNIDDSIRNLKEGDYLYVRPNETDIIAVSLSDINISGNKATVVGGDNTEDMFDFVKINADNDDFEVTKIEETNKDDIDYIGTHEENGIETYDFNISILKDEEQIPAIMSNNLDEIVDYALWMENFKKNLSLTEKQEIQLGSEKKLEIPAIDNNHLELKGTLSLKLPSLNVNFYKRYKELSIDIEIKASVSAKVTGKLKVESNEIPLFYLWCATPIMGVQVIFSPSLKIEGKVEFEVSCEFSPSIKASYDGGSGLKITNTPDNVAKTTAFNYKVAGTVTITIDLKPAIVFISEKIASLGAEASVGLELTAPLLDAKWNLFEKNVDDIFTIKKCYFPIVVDNEPIDGTIDECAARGFPCFTVNSKLFFKGAIVFDAFILKQPLKVSTPSFDINLPDAYISLAFNEVGFGECPHKYCRVKLVLCGTTDQQNNIESIQVDGEKAYMSTSDLGVVAYMYCRPNSSHQYSYKTKDGKTSGEQSFTVKNAGTTVMVDLSSNSVTVDNPTMPVTSAVTMPTVTTVLTTTNEKQGQEENVANGRLNNSKTTPKWPVEELPESDITYTLSRNGYMSIIGYGNMKSNQLSKNDIIKNNLKEVVIEDLDPDNGQVITNIGANLFKDCENLETVVLPATIETIDSFAFSGCKNLKSITYEGSPNAGKKAIDLPLSIKSIGDSAFKNCSSLEGELDFTRNSALVEIGTEAFFGNGITSLTIPSTVKNVGQKAFGGCLTLSKATIYGSDEMSISTIFDNNTGLEEMTVYNLTDILKNFKCGDTCNFLDGSHHFHLFFYNLNYPDTLETIIVKNDEAIGTGAFRNMKQLKNIILPEKLKSIGNSSFSECNSLEKIEIPETVEEIGNYAFSNCSSLKTITIPDGIKSIPDGCFNGCTSLESIDLPESIDSIGSFAFSGTKEYLACYSLKSITIPSNVTVLPDSCFANCTGLEKVILSENIIQIPVNCFKNCKSLKSIAFPEGVQKIVSPDHIAEIVLGCDNLTEIYIPKTISFIAENSFGVTINDDFGTVYYGGTEEEWEALKKKQSVKSSNSYYTSEFNFNDSIFNANVIFNAKPEDMSSYVASQEEFVPSGDVNGNSKLDLGDALAILQYIANSSKYPLSEEAIKQADVYNTGDGITPMDALAIQQYDAGLIDSLPVYR